MIKDYSKIPANKKIINDSEKDITFNMRDKWAMIPVTVSGKGSVDVTANTSEDLALLTAQCEDLELNVVDNEQSEVYPEITTFTISPEVGLIEGNENVQADAVVATLSTSGGTADYVYSFKEDAENGKDNAKFKIDGTNVKVNTTPLETGDYKIALTVTDANSKTKDQNATISVAAPEVTELNADITPDLQEGNPNVEANATIATLSTVGGIAPYTYELNVDEVNGANNDSFVIADDKLNVGETPLTEGEYKVSVKVTDKNDKTAIKNLDISVSASA